MRIRHALLALPVAFMALPSGASAYELCRSSILPQNVIIKVGDKEFNFAHRNSPCENTDASGPVSAGTFRSNLTSCNATIAEGNTSKVVIAVTRHPGEGSRQPWISCSRWM